MNDNRELIIEMADSLSIVCTRLKESLEENIKIKKKMSKIEKSMASIASYFEYEREQAEAYRARQEIQDAHAGSQDWIGKIE